MNISGLDLKPISEAEVISVFLKGELKSERFSEKIKMAIEKLGVTNSIIQNPDLNNSQENDIRLEILEETRKYVSRKGLFGGFPQNIKWFRVEVSKDFLINEVLFINYDYWVELTNGSRLSKDAVRKIRNNEMVYDVPYDNLLEASEYFKKNKSFDEMILVSDGNEFVVLEGHLRLTVLALNKDILPEKISVIMGVSEDMNKWGLF
jgi:hypothetical protein